MVTMVWVVSTRFRLKAPPGISFSCISPLTSSGQRSRASWASQPQKSGRRETTKVHKRGGGKCIYIYIICMNNGLFIKLLHMYIKSRRGTTYKVTKDQKITVGRVCLLGGRKSFDVSTVYNG